MHLEEEQKLKFTVIQELTDKTNLVLRYRMFFKCLICSHTLKPTADA